MHYYKNAFAHKCYYCAYGNKHFLLFSFHVTVHKCACVINSTWLDNEYTYENGVQFEIKSLQSMRLSSFIVCEEMISVIVDQNFTMNAIGLVLESV